MGLNVLSLFDGMSCGQIALNKLQIKYNNYFASEIDKYAINVTMQNYPNTIQLGDVKNINIATLPKIDLLLGGSPCQGFSIAGKQQNFEDPRSALFFEYVRLLKECKPKYFLLENVKMKKEYLDVISSYLKVEPILLNSADFSAQTRFRYYWTNIPVDMNYAKSKLVIKDILLNNVPEKYYIPFVQNLTICKNINKNKRIAYIQSNSQGNRIYDINHKGITLCGLGGGRGAKTGLYAVPSSPAINNIEKFCHITYPNNQKHIVRKLHPIECERLQNVPDNYTNYASDSQRYKMLGNGWTVNAVSHILKKIQQAGV